MQTRKETTLSQRRTADSYKHVFVGLTVGQRVCGCPNTRHVKTDLRQLALVQDASQVAFGEATSRGRSRNGRQLGTSGTGSCAAGWWSLSLKIGPPTPRRAARRRRCGRSSGAWNGGSGPHDCVCACVRVCVLCQWSERLVGWLAVMSVRSSHSTTNPLHERPTFGAAVFAMVAARTAAWQPVPWPSLVVAGGWSRHARAHLTAKLSTGILRLRCEKQSHSASQAVIGPPLS